MWLSLDLNRVSPVIKNLLELKIVLKFRWFGDWPYDPGPGAFDILDGFNVVLMEELPKGAAICLAVDIKLLLIVFIFFSSFELFREFTILNSVFLLDFLNGIFFTDFPIT